MGRDHRQLVDAVHDIHPLDDARKDDVSAVKVHNVLAALGTVAAHGRDHELRVVAVGPVHALLRLLLAHRRRARHGHPARPRMPQVGRLVVKHLPVNGLAAAAVVVDDIAALDEHPLPNLKVAPGAVGGLIEQFHRSVVDIDGAVEAGALVVQPLAALVGDPLLAGAERAEVLGRLRHDVGAQLHDDAARRRTADRHVEENLGLRHC
mmetsp:Transcript_61205/g.167959  ORF Transcript_61205/g.167959 Transcript_61205/m.167959 type:complete len:207 (+) Transcript_61205:480-1100(+)